MIGEDGATDYLYSLPDASGPQLGITGCDFHVSGHVGLPHQER